MPDHLLTVPEALRAGAPGASVIVSLEFNNEIALTLWVTQTYHQKSVAYSQIHGVYRRRELLFHILNMQKIRPRNQERLEFGIPEVIEVWYLMPSQPTVFYTRQTRML